MPQLTDALPCQALGRFTFEDGTVVTDAAFSYELVHPSGPSEGLVIICPSLTGTPSILQDWWTDVGASRAQQHYTTLYPHAFTAETV